MGTAICYDVEYIRQDLRFEILFHNTMPNQLKKLNIPMLALGIVFMIFLSIYTVISYFQGNFIAMIIMILIMVSTWIALLFWPDGSMKKDKTRGP